MSLEQETLNYVYYCDSLMLTNILNPHLATIVRNINWIIQIPFIWPSDPHDPENNDPLAPDVRIDLTQFQHWVPLSSTIIFNGT